MGGCNIRLSINNGIINGQTSDWGFSEVVVWNRVLPYAEMKKVSDAMLKSVCGGSHFWNSVSNLCTACPVETISGGSGCICNQSGYYYNSVKNTCMGCPVGSNSTGIGCTCVGNTFFNRLSSTCDPYFSDGVIGDAPWGIWRAQSYDSGSSLVLRESRGNGRDITISGSITINNSSGNGALNPVYSLQGGTSSTMLWPTTLTGDFTICSMTRYTESTNKMRILAGVNEVGYCGGWFHGHYNGKRGLAHYDTWKTHSSASRGTLTDWLVMCGQNSATNSDAPPNSIIADGMYNIVVFCLLQIIFYSIFLRFFHRIFCWRL